MPQIDLKMIVVITLAFVSSWSSPGPRLREESAEGESLQRQPEGPCGRLIWIPDGFLMNPLSHHYKPPPKQGPMLQIPLKKARAHLQKKLCRWVCNLKLLWTHIVLLMVSIPDHYTSLHFIIPNPQ